MSDRRIAIAHKDYDVRGGGEVLAEELARVFDAPLYVGHGKDENHPEQPDIDIREIAPESRLHRLMARTGTAARGVAHMIHWRDNAPSYLDEYDTIVMSGNEPLWTLTEDWQTVVAYTHSTPRWMYDLYHDVNGFIGRTYNQFQRRLYEGAVKRPDLWVANSDLVARRINKYWNIPMERIVIVYPPVPTDEYDPDEEETGDYYLYLGRLDEHKKVGEVVRAFNERGDRLVIAGKGPMKAELERAANENVEFAGFVSEAEKRRLYSGAKALIYPAQNEDFGMVPIEAMAAGTPVIGVDEGFTRYQIQPGENGYLYDRSAAGLADAINSFEREGVELSEEELAEWASRWFSPERFAEEMRAAVTRAEEDTAVTPPWATEENTARKKLGADVEV